MSIVEYLSQPFWQRLGLTLVHFLWQGLAVAVLVGVFVRVLRLKHGNARYVAYLLAFIAMIACPVVTFTVIDIPIIPETELLTVAEPAAVVDISPSPYTALPADDVLPEVETRRPAIPISADSIPLGQRISDWLNVSMPWILVIWMAGVVVLSVRLLMGFVGVYRWRHHLEALPERLAQRIASLSEGLGMRGFSRVFISPTVLQAMAVGYLRPMVLLPAAMVTQMQPEILEAVIAHELAHIRRFDLWVNLIQRVTETLLFYHPAVWWLSICLRSERELCCDELAVKATGRRLTYATTLASVGRARLMAKPPVLATGLGQDKKPTLGRVRHILGLKPTQRNCPFWLSGVITVLFLAALVIPTTLALTSRTNEQADIEEKKDQKELSKFKTTLANGVTVELIGMCEYPSVGKQWWRPDGSLLVNPPYDESNLDILSSRSPDAIPIEFAFRLSGNLSEPAWEARVKGDEQAFVWWTGRQAKDGEFLTDIKSIGMFVKSDQRTLDLRLGFSLADRPYEWVDFKNISIKPNFKPDVQVEGEVEFELITRPLTIKGIELQLSKVATLQYWNEVFDLDSETISHYEPGTRRWPKGADIGFDIDMPQEISDSVFWGINDGYETTGHRFLALDSYSFEQAVWETSSKLDELRNSKWMGFGLSKHTLPKFPEFFAVLTDGYSVKSGSTVEHPSPKLAIIEVVEARDKSAEIKYWLERKTQNKPAVEVEGTGITAEKESEFSAILPNGIRVELIGMCEYPSVGKQWWRPDGTPFTLPAGIKIEDRISRVSDNAYQFLFRYNSQEDLTWNSLDAVCLHFSIEGDSGVSLINLRRLPKDGQDGLFAKVAIFKEPLDSTTIQANLATGNWQTQAVRDISKIDQRNEDLYWFTSETPSIGLVSLEILHRIEGQQIKTIAIDREGNEYDAGYSLGSFGGRVSISQIEGRRYHASVRKDDRLVKFKLQSRPFWSSVIGNVSLKPNFKPAVQGKSQHIDVETLLNKVRQAQRPTANMIVEWQSEKPQPVFAARPGSLKPDFSPPARILQTYKAIIAGDKSRIEERELTFQSQKDTEPSRIREIIYVFDGTTQKQLDHFVKGFENEYRGYRHTYDKNTQLLLELLLAYPPYLDNPELPETYNIKVIENKEKGLIILETSKENSGIHRFTIDPDKDYNIVKQEVILTRGKDYEINCIVKKQANGLWYQVAREQIRYSVKTGKPSLENKVTITKLDFNPEIPTGAFELQFPKGIKIWDGSLKDWVIVGDEEETSGEPAVQVEVEKTASNNSGGDSKRYQLVTFREGVSIREALRFLGKAHKKNIIPSEKVTGQVPVNELYNVTFEETLQAILGTHKYIIDGQFIRVYTEEEFESIYPEEKTNSQVEIEKTAVEVEGESSHYFEQRFELGKDIGVQLEVGKLENWILVSAKTIRFEKDGDNVGVELTADVRKGHGMEWLTKVELLDANGRVLDTRKVTKSPHGLSDPPVMSVRKLEFLPFEWDKIGGAVRFRVSFEQLSPIRDAMGRELASAPKELIQGRITDPKGQPVADAVVTIAEYNPRSKVIRVAKISTNQRGYYKLGQVDWPYYIVVQRLLPTTFGQPELHQSIRLKKVFEGAQTVDLQFDEFPKGSASLECHIVDKDGKAVEKFHFMVLDDTDWETINYNDPAGGYIRTKVYRMDVDNTEGRFTVEDLPAGSYKIWIIPKDGRYKDKRYEDTTEKIFIEEGAHVKKVIEVPSKYVLYGRVLFEDGSPAVVEPTPWPGAKTSIIKWDAGLSFGGGIGEVDDDGYFQVYLSQKELEQVEEGKSRLSITIPTHEEGRRRTVGKFPFEILSEDRDKAGVIRVKRPEKQKPTKPAVRVEGTGITADKESEFSAILPNGVTVELIGMCEYPNVGKQWWRPDGSLLVNPPYDESNLDILSSRKPNAIPIEFAFRLSGNLGDPAWEARVKRDEQAFVWWTGRQSKDGKFLTDIKSIGMFVKSDQRTLDLRLGFSFADGPYEWVDFKNISVKPNFKPDVQVEAEEVWGEAVAGVQARLYGRKESWREDEIPRFYAAVRNNSSDDLFARWTQDDCRLEVDGRWYSWSGRTTAELMPLSAGKKLDHIFISLNSLWRTVDGRELRFTPGRHTVSLAVPAFLDKGQVLPAIQPISNPVRLEITPAGDIGLVWGEEVNGLRASVEFVPDKPEYSFGERIDLRFHIQNVSNKTIQFISEAWRQDQDATIEDGDGNMQTVPGTWYTGVCPIDRYYLEPGEKVVIDSYDLGIARDHKQAEQLKHPVGYRLRCEGGVYYARFGLRLPGIGSSLLPAEDADFEGMLETGPHKLTVVVASNDPNAQTIPAKSTNPAVKPGEQVKGEKPALVWGDQVNGLRAAVEFVPEKESYDLEERVGVRFHIQNVSNEDVQFSSMSGRQYWPTVKDSNGKEVKVDTWESLGTWSYLHHIIKPGQILTLKNTGLIFSDFHDSALLDKPKWVGIAGVVRCGPGQYSIYYKLNRTLETGVRKVTVNERPPVNPRSFELTLDQQSMLQAIQTLRRKYRVRICFEQAGFESGSRQHLLTGTFFAPTIPELLDKLTETSLYKWEKFYLTYAVYPKQNSLLRFSVKTDISESPLESVTRVILDQDPRGKQIEIESVCKGRMRWRLWISRASAMYALSGATARAGISNSDVVWTLTLNRGVPRLYLHRLSQAPQTNEQIKADMPDEKDQLLWGEPVEGVQVRLRTEKAVWESGKVPTFHADVRNNGEREIVLPISEHGWRLEFDGEWYESRTLVIVGLWKLPPGEEYCGVKFSLGSWWLRTKNLRERIQLTPGKHTVRVSCYTKRDSGSGIRAISNPVEIEILAKYEKDGVVDVATTKATLVEWLVSEGGNGHFYEAIAVPGGISWTDASEAANLKGGYLVTITSQAENDFVHDLINDALYWDGPCGPWIGGYQPEGSPEPEGGWRWVTNEPLLYSNWNNQQPNEFHGNNENRIHFGYIARTPFWNDVPDTAVIEDGRRIRGYIVETIPATAVGAGGAEPDDPTPPVRPLSEAELDGKEILKKLKSSDAVYEAAFTASGTRPGWPVKRKWKLTMMHGEIVYQDEVVETANADAPKRARPGRRGDTEDKPWLPFRRTYYVGPTVQAEHQWVGRIRRYGPLDPWPENRSGPATVGILGVVKPDAPTYMLLIKQPLLCLGRGYSRYVTEIKDASRQANGRLKVTAEGIDIAYRPGAKWELVIDPDAEYMVRSAKLVDNRNRRSSFTNSGLKRYGSRCVPEKAECKGKYIDASFEIQSASSEVDSEFLKHAKDTMRPPYLIHTDIKDNRVSPGLYLSYDAGKVSPNGKIKDWDIGFEEPKQPATQWGEPVEGLAVRLRAKGATTAKRVTLLADARNDGPGTYRGTRSTHGCWLKVDGKWYGRVQTRESVAPMLLKAGDRQLAFTQIRLSSEKSPLWRGGFITHNGQVPSLGAREIHQAEPLELSPGRHTVRLAFPASRKAYAYSNAVEIEVLPAEEKPAVQVEMGALSFCSVVECVLSEQSMHYSIDLDTGKTVEQAAKPGRTGLEGMDAHVVIKDDKRGLQFHEVFAGYQRGIAAEKTWEEKTAQELSQSLHDATWGIMRMPIRDHFPWEEMSQQYLTAEDELPMTLEFMTRHGTKGLLQLIEFTNNPKGVKIRYKLIKQIDNDRKPTVQVEAEETEKTDSLVWGKEVNGLRAAVEFVPEKESYEQGEVVGIRFHLQNVSNQIINLATPRWWIQSGCLAEDQLGIKMPARTVPEPWGRTTIDRHKLLPGQVIKLESGSLAIAKDKTQRDSLCKYPVRNVVILKPGRYSLYYWLSFPGLTRLDGNGKVVVPQPDDWQGALETGKRKLVITSNAESDQEPTVPVEVEGGWGEAVEGIQMRVRAERQRWYEGETPRFRVDMRNKGTVEWELGLTQENWEVELDGLWHRVGASFSGDFRTLLFGPGQEHRDIEFYPGVWSDWNIHGRPLKLTPGLHAVRLSFGPSTRDRAYWRRLRVVSNPVLIEILPAEADKRGWGEAVAGLQCGLRADKRFWKTDETPKLQALARNIGRSPWRLPRPSKLFYLKVGSEVWRWKGTLSDRPADLKPGEVLDKTTILLSEDWVGAYGSDLRLKLSPGKHIVQLVMFVSAPAPPKAVPGTKPVPKQLRIESNVVAIEVLKGERNGTVDNEDDAATTLQAELQELRRQRDQGLAGAEAFGKRLLEKYTKREEKPLIYYELAEIYAQSGQADPNKIVEFARQGWWYLNDPVKKARLFIYWGDALQLTKGRRDAGKIYLRGLQFCLQYGLPQEKPELPTVSKYTVDGPAEEVETYDKEHKRQMAARKHARLIGELIEHRHALTGRIVQLYAPLPDAFDELHELVMRYLGSEQASQQIIAAAKSYRTDIKTAIPVIMRVGGDPNPRADLDWGQETKGIRVRLRADTRSWGAGGVPKFKLDVRNDGSHILMLTSAPDCWGIEVDGIWYRVTIPMLGGAKGMSFGPDKRWYNLELSLDKALGSENENVGFELGPGRHTVRAVLSKGQSEDGGPVSIRAVSNPVEIVILPTDSDVKTVSTGT